MADAEVSLRPLVARANVSGSNPFSSFGKGLGQGVKSKLVTSVFFTGPDDVAVKKTGPRIRYGKDFLMQFMTVYTKIPAEVAAMTDLEVVVTEADQETQRLALQKTAEEIGDDRDWRTRNPGSAGPPAARSGDRDRDFDRDFSRETRDAPTSSSAPAERDTSAAAPAAKDVREQGEIREQRQSKLPTQQPASQPRAPVQQQQPSAQQQQAMAQPQSSGSSEQVNTAKMQKAEDIGRQAYKVGATISGEERALRRIKGILNKLTPETFDKLQQQLLEVITTADILQQTITIVFENAVEQPTFCALYADLCVRLSKELPSFPPPAGTDRPVAFGQILLNTCQDEFEGAEVAREALNEVTDTAQREDGERKVKKRVMGNMRLISELYKQDMVKDWIMTTCIDELLATRANKLAKVPPEDNIESACEILSTAGSKLCKSDKGETSKKVDKVFKELERLGAEKVLPSRIRFVIRDVLELKRSGWVPRREVFTARKLEDIRSQAEAELGMISSSIAASLPSLPTQQRSNEQAEFELIPPLRSEVENWAFPALKADGKSFSGQSALLGDYTPAPQRPVAVAPPPPEPVPEPVAAPVEAPASREAGVSLSEEELTRKVESLLAEFCQTLDKKEATMCVRELGSPELLAKVMEMGLSTMLNSLKDKEQAALAELLLFLHSSGAVTSKDVMEALVTFTVQLEDLSLDVPKAPTLLGSFFGNSVCAGILGLDLLPQLLEGECSVEPKRDFAGAALKVLLSKKGAKGCFEACTEAGFTLGSFLTGDAEFDKDSLPLEKWANQEGFTMLAL